MSLVCNGTSQGAESASALSGLAGLTTVTVAGWLKTDYTFDDDIWLETSGNSNNNNGAWMIIAGDSAANSPNGRIVNKWNNPTTGANTQAVNAPSDNVWHHIVAQMNYAGSGSTEAGGIWYDGVSQSTTLDAPNDNSSMASYVLYLMHRFNTGTRSLWCDGETADIGIWDVLLTQGNINSLQTGRCNTVDSGNLIYYWPLTSDLNAVVGGINLSGIGSPTFGSDPSALAPAGPTAGDLIIDRS